MILDNIKTSGLSYNIDFLEQIRSHLPEIERYAVGIPVTNDNVIRFKGNVNKFLLSKGILPSMFILVKLLNNLQSNDDLQEGELLIPNTEAIETGGFLLNLVSKSGL